MMKGVVLAAGKGERLRPLTDTRPKHMIPIGGRPLLEWIIQGLKEAGVKEILIVTHYMEDLIKEYFRDGSALGIEIKYAKQDRMLGTADAFRVAEGFVGDEEFIGLYGDLFISSSVFRTLLQSHKKGETSICVIPVKDPSQFGIIELEGDRVVGIIEKPPPGEEPSNLGNTGVYIFTPEIFDKIRETGVSLRNEYEVTDSLKVHIESGSKVRAVPVDPNDWLDIGLPWSILKANARALEEREPKIMGCVEEGATISGPVTVAEGARVRTGSYIEGPVYIGPGSDIGPNCYLRPATSIGAGVRVGNACELKNSLIMEGTHIAHLSYIGDSVIGSGCNFGAGTITANIRFDKKSVKVKVKGIPIDSGQRKLGAIVGDDAQTGVNVSLLPGIKVGVQAWIAPGLTVYEDIPPRTFLTDRGARLRRDIESP
ncbi:MAG: sugar phosphate nucleotidyltransferase [Candidatus Bathyarchaeota archaeon]|jgi:bifunctional UDP-N-acetylglucosamine pyrophosphorylase/glucosamine-1-phosphate N-acetyltransferase